MFGSIIGSILIYSGLSFEPEVGHINYCIISFLLKIGVGNSCSQERTEDCPCLSATIINIIT